MENQEQPPKPLVEILENGDILFSGNRISAHEYAAGAALCSLQSEVDEDSVQVIDGGLSGAKSDASTTELTDDDDNDEESAGILKPSKRRRNKVTKPKNMANDDVRLTYTEKWFDAVNAVDAAAMKHMLSEIAITKPVFVSTMATGSPNALGYIFPTHFEVVGVDAIATFFEAGTRAVPDFQFVILHETISSYVNGESSIELTVQTKGTKVFEIEGMPHEGAEEKVVLSSGAQPSVVDQLSAGVATLNVNTNLLGLGGLMKVRKPFTLNHRVTFHLNRNKKIFLIVSAK